MVVRVDMRKAFKIEVKVLCLPTNGGMRSAGREDSRFLFRWPTSVISAPQPFVRLEPEVVLSMLLGRSRCCDVISKLKRTLFVDIAAAAFTWIAGSEHIS